MNFLKRLLGPDSVPDPPDLAFRVGDRVRDTWGNKHPVPEVNRSGEQGLGIIRTRRADGAEFGHALVAHGLTRLSEEEAAPSPANHLTVQRVKPEESSASAYLRSDTIVLCGTCITNIGGLQSGPYRSLKTSGSDVEIGAAL